MAEPFYICPKGKACGGSHVCRHNEPHLRSYVCMHTALYVPRQRAGVYKNCPECIPCDFVTVRDERQLDEA